MNGNSQAIKKGSLMEMLRSFERDETKLDKYVMKFSIFVLVVLTAVFIYLKS